MPSYVVINRPLADYRPSAEAGQLWTEWFTQLGDHLIDRGNPVFRRETVGDVDGTTVLGGYTLISADDLEQAVELARTCPAIRHGGSAEIGELTILNAGTDAAQH